MTTITTPPDIARTVLITGVTSFIGLHLANGFAAAGYRTVATHVHPRQHYDGIRAARLAALHPDITCDELNICDKAAVSTALEKHVPDLWIHHAGYATNYGAVDYDMDAGQRINVAPLDHLFRELSESNTGVLVTGSSAEYSDTDDADHEDDVCEPVMPYGKCKLAETLRAHELSQRFDVPTRVARVYIPFGRLDNPIKLLDQVMMRLRAGQVISLSPCTQKRDFISVDDLVDGYLALANDLNRGGFDLFNICRGEATILADLVRTLAELLNADPALLHFGARPMREGEPPVSYGSNEKARTILNWTPRDLTESLKRSLL